MKWANWKLVKGRYVWHHYRHSGPHGQDCYGEPPLFLLARGLTNLFLWAKRAI